MWSLERFIIFFDQLGYIVQMEVSNTFIEYYQWLAIADGYGYGTMTVTEEKFDKVVKNPRHYQVINGKLKYLIEHPLS